MRPRPNEAQMCRGSDVVLVGGGNSAGQAAVYLSQNARKVFLLIRGDDLCKSMSSYLAHRIMNTPNIEILRCTEVTRMGGDGHLSSIEIVDKLTGRSGPSKRARFSVSSARRRGPIGCRPKSRRTRNILCAPGIDFGRFTALDVEAAAVPVGNEPAGRVRRRRCALRLSQARRLRRRRRLDVGPVRP